MKSNFPGGSPSEHVAYIREISKKLFEVREQLQRDAKRFCENEKSLAEIEMQSRNNKDHLTKPIMDKHYDEGRRRLETILDNQREKAKRMFRFFHSQLEMLLLEILLFYKRPVRSAYRGDDNFLFVPEHSFHKNLLCSFQSLQTNPQHPITRHLPTSSVQMLDKWRRMRNAIKAEIHDADYEHDPEYDIDSMLFGFSRDGEVISKAIKGLIHEMDISASSAQDVDASKEATATETKHTDSEMQTPQSEPATFPDVSQNLADAVAQIDVSGIPVAISPEGKTEASTGSPCPEDLNSEGALTCASALER